VLTFTASVALYAAVAASLPFYDKGEPREALVVEAMLRGDGMILPRPDGRHVPSKPPLFHWLAALAATNIGRTSELAMRLPSVVFGALGVALTMVVCARWYGAAAGLVAAIVLASSFEWMRAATQSRVDMTLTFFVVAATLAWQRGVVEPERRWTIRAGWLAAAAAVLTKGPVGVVLPALVVGADALRRREPRALVPLADVAGTTVALVACLGWYGLAWMDGGAEFASRHLVQENVQRFVGWGAVAHRHPALYYVPALAGGFLPWTLALPLVVRDAWSRRRREDGFLVVWIVAVLAFYSLAAGKRSTYLLPIFPPLAMLTGTALVASADRAPAAWARTGLVAASVVLLGVALAVGMDRTAPLVAQLGGLVRGTDQARMPAALAAVHAQRWMIATTLGIAAATLLGVASPGGTRAWRLAAVTTAALVATVGLTTLGTYPVARSLTTRPFATRVLTHLRPGDRLCACGDLDGGLRFYLGRPIPRCNDLDPATAAPTRASAIHAPATGLAGARRHYRVTPVHQSDVALGRSCASHGHTTVASRSEETT